jgi:ATP-dependent DNA helicase MPH1
MGTKPGDLLVLEGIRDASRYRELDVPPFVASDGEEETSDDNRRHTQNKRHNDEVGTTAAFSHTTAPRKRQKTIAASVVSSQCGAADLFSSSGDTIEEVEIKSPHTRTGRNSSRTSRPRKPRKGKKKTQGRGGINSDEIGDDCNRESDDMETDGSDDGADLVDFLVSDNHVTSSIRESEPPSSTLESLATPRAASSKPFFVPTEFPATQESEGIPDLTSLTSAESKGGGGTNTSDVAPRQARGKRRIVEDSDEDEW